MPHTRLINKWAGKKRNNKNIQLINTKEKKFEHPGSYYCHEMEWSGESSRPKKKKKKKRKNSASSPKQMTNPRTLIVKKHNK